MASPCTAWCSTTSTPSDGCGQHDSFAERTDPDYVAGETDGDRILVDGGLCHDERVETLVHEALHDSVFVARPTRSGERKGLPCDVEHAAMCVFFGRRGCAKVAFNLRVSTLHDS